MVSYSSEKLRALSLANEFPRHKSESSATANVLNAAIDFIDRFKDKTSFKGDSTLSGRNVSNLANATSSNQHESSL